MSSKEPKTKFNDEEEVLRLKIAQRRDEFLITRVFKYSLLLFYLIGLGSLAVFVILQLFTNEVFRTTILNIFAENITAIIVSGLSILGIYRATQRPGSE